MGRTRNRAEQMCPGCGESKTLDSFQHARVMTTHCYDCRHRRGEIAPPCPPSRARLMQELRTPCAQPMSESECTMTSLARLISGRGWPIQGEVDDYELHKRLMSALFAAGYHVLPTHGAEIRVQAGVSIDVALGDTADCVMHVLNSLKRLSGRRGGLVVIAQAPIGRAIVDGIERHAGMPLFVHSPLSER